MLTEANSRGEMDLPRTSQGTAIIGDPRNDENVVVSQMQLIFLQAHNAFAKQVEDENQLDPDLWFSEAQRRLRWHYQWLVVEDFLRRTCRADVLSKLFYRTGGSVDVRRPNFQPSKNPYMPVEFSVAAFRFGHSQVRPTYDLNQVATARPIFAAGDDVGELDDLRGFRPLPAGWTVDWRLFLENPGQAPQPSRLINSKLSSALFDLPGESDPHMQSLAFRNLKRGQALELPSGQDVARALKAPRVLAGNDLAAPDPTPLWFYILKEAELEEDNLGATLGFVGSQIVAQVLLGLLELDPHSWLSRDPLWTPNLPKAGDHFVLADLVRFATESPTAPEDSAGQ